MIPYQLVLLLPEAFQAPATVVTTTPDTACFSVVIEYPTFVIAVLPDECALELLSC